MKLFLKIYYVLKKYDKRFYIISSCYSITIQIESLKIIHSVFSITNKEKIYINYVNGAKDYFITKILRLIDIISIICNKKDKSILI